MMERRRDVLPVPGESTGGGYLFASDRIFRLDCMQVGLRCLACPSDFTPHASVDKIAEFFVNLILDLVDRTVYSMEKNTPEGRDRIRNSVMSYFCCEKERVDLFLDTLLAGQPLEQVLRENYIFLTVFRRKYRNLIRGMRPQCWGEVTRAIDRRLPECEAHRACWGDGEEDPGADGRMRCEVYRENWSGTKLVVTGREDLQRDPPALMEIIYERCRVIRDFTDPGRLEEFLGRECWKSSGGAERRTVSGLIIRILTDFVDYCLLTLSRNLELPRGKGFYLVRSPLFRLQ